MNKNFRFFRVMAVFIAVAAVFGQEQKLTLDEAIAEKRNAYRNDSAN